MSVDLHVYAPSLKNELTPHVIKRLKELGIECEVAPGFVLLDHSGFLPIRMKVIAPDAPENVKNRDLLTGFECAVGAFDYRSELEKLKRGKKANFFRKLLGIGDDMPASPSRNYIASKDIDEVLVRCKQILEINFHSPTELLISNSFAAVVAELSNGIVYDPQSDEYLQPAKALAQIAEDMRACSDVADCEPFTGWSE